MVLIINFFILYKTVVFNYEKKKRNKTKYDKQRLLNRLSLIRLQWDRFKLEDK